MHDVFGMEVLNLFDMKNGDFYIGTADDRPDDEGQSKDTNEDTSDLSGVELEEVDLDAVAKETKESQNSDESEENKD